MFTIKHKLVALAIVAAALAASGGASWFSKSF
jgi:hypothetical protein